MSIEVNKTTNQTQHYRKKANLKRKRRHPTIGRKHLKSGTFLLKIEILERG